MSSHPMREARIDLSAIGRNVGAALTGNPAVVVDVSGDAFGHGAIEVARVASDCGAIIGVRDPSARADLAAVGIGSMILEETDVGTVDASYGTTGPGSPVMRVSARIVSVKTIDAGEPVSYGYTWRAPIRSTLALVPLGYADGVVRSSSNRGSMWLAGAMRPIVGRVAMDVSVLDLGTDSADVGDEAILFWDPLVGESVEEWSAALEFAIDPLSITAGIGARLPRRWTK